VGREYIHSCKFLYPYGTSLGDSTIHCYCYCFTPKLRVSKVAVCCFSWGICYVVPADLSQQAKSAAAEGLTYSESNRQKSAENFNLSTFCPLEKKLPDFNTFSSSSLLKSPLQHQTSSGRSRRVQIGEKFIFFRIFLTNNSE
jgi:hypothetical protein